MFDIFAAVLTDYVPSHINDISAEEYEAKDDTIFDMGPEYVVLNRDDKNFEEFKKTFKGDKATFTYGENRESDLVIESSKLYKMGSEAHLSFEGKRFTTASFLNKQTDISYMACAAALALALGIDTESIENGIAAYDPQGLVAEKDQQPSEEASE